MRPAVSVVIPTYRRPALLRRCVEAVLAQRLSPDAYEVIVVDDGHDDATRDTVDALRTASSVRLRYLRPLRGRGPAVARNAGWRAASAPLIAFTDDDTIPAPGWLVAGVITMDAEPGLSAVCGAVQVPARDEPPTDHERMTRGLERAEFVTANAFVRRAALERIDGFDERFQRAWREDSDLQFRLARDVGPVGRALLAEVVHPVREERWGVSLRQQRNTFFDALLYKKHPRLYRQRIRRVPPWNYYAMVASAFSAPLALLGGAPVVAAVLAGVWLLLVAHLSARRLASTARSLPHVVEMVVTSALIPFLSVYWRLRGAWNFRVPFL